MLFLLGLQAKRFYVTPQLHNSFAIHGEIINSDLKNGLEFSSKPISYLFEFYFNPNFLAISAGIASL